MGSEAPWYRSRGYAAGHCQEVDNSRSREIKHSNDVYVDKQRDQQRCAWSKDSRGSRGYSDDRCIGNGHRLGRGECRDRAVERISSQRFDHDRDQRDQFQDRNNHQESERDQNRNQYFCDEMDQPNSSCIWLGGCPNDITEREIENLCSKHGPVHKITVKHSSRDTFVFVQYGQPSHAKEAIRGLNQAMAFGSGIIKVAPANRKGSNKREDEPENQLDAEQDRACKRNHDREHYIDGRQEHWEGPHRGRPESIRERSRSCDRSRVPPAQGHRPVRVYLSQLPRDMEEDELQEIAAEYGKVLQYELHREGAYKCGWVEYGRKREAEVAISELDDRRMNEWNMRLQAYMYPGGDA